MSDNIKKMTLKKVKQEIAIEVYWAVKNGVSLRFLRDLFCHKTYESAYRYVCQGATLLNKSDYPPMKRGRYPKWMHDLIDDNVPKGISEQMEKMDISMCCWAKFYNMTFDQVIDLDNLEKVSNFRREDFAWVFPGPPTLDYEFPKIPSELSRPLYKGKTVKIISRHFAGIQFYGGKATDQYALATEMHSRLCELGRIRAFNAANGDFNDRVQAAIEWVPEVDWTGFEILYTSPKWIMQENLYYAGLKKLDAILLDTKRECTERDRNEVWSDQQLENLGQRISDAQSAIAAYERDNTWKIKVGFDHPKLIEFWRKYVAGQGLAEELMIRELLSYLDARGDCASVVDKFPDGKKSEGYDNSDYAKLAKFTILDHSLRVAEYLLLSNGNFERGATIIAALAHDLGKVTGHEYPHLYWTKLHPEWSVLTLQKMVYFDSCPNKNDIQHAVLCHHEPRIVEHANLTKLHDRLPVKLAESDVAARDEECELAGIPIRERSQIRKR